MNKKLVPAYESTAPCSAAPSARGPAVSDVIASRVSFTPPAAAAGTASDAPPPKKKSKNSKNAGAAPPRYPLVPGTSRPRSV